MGPLSKIGLMKSDNGVFHQEEKYYRGYFAVLSTLIFIVLFIPITYFELNLLGIKMA